MLISALSLATGAVLAVWLPVRQFVVGLLLVTIAGGAVAVGVGHPLGATVMWGAIAYCVAQVGYGCGLGLLALGMPGKATFGEKFASRVWRQQPK